MTREEAVKILKSGEIVATTCDMKAYTEAREMAIKALEQYTDKAKEVGELLESLQKANATNTTLIKLLEGKQKPCEDAVSRAEVIDELNRLGRNAFKDDTDYDRFFAFLDNLLPVTPTHKAGKWIEHIVRDDFDDAECVSYECNQCHSSYAEDDLNFCPNCGADMREEDK